MRLWGRPEELPTPGPSPPTPPGLQRNCSERRFSHLCPAGLSSCSGGLRPLVELCVEPASLCGRCRGVAVPLRVVPSPDWEILSSPPKRGGRLTAGRMMGVRTTAPWKPACEALQSKPKNTGMVGTVLTREAGPGIPTPFPGWSGLPCAQHEGALPPPCIVRKDPRVPAPIWAEGTALPRPQ